MDKVYLFLKKFLAFALNAFVFGVFMIYKIHWFYSAPALILSFSLIVSRITGENPKELFNFQRSEKYFVKGGLRDLVRIPVVLFAFIHDVFVWEIWGIYNVFLLFVDFIHFIKAGIFWLIQGIIWFLLLLVPFWRILIKFLFLYLVKWPWWIYRYAYKALLNTFNRNVLRISVWGTFIALLTIQFFYFLDITLNLSGLWFIGCALALLPVSWIFGEIAALRGQKMLDEPYYQVKLQFRNGLETVRDILFFLTSFVVLLIAQAGLNLLGWIPKSGIILLGIGINVNFIINLLLLFLIFIISLGSVVLPTYQIYNEFRETSLPNILQLLSYIGKRFFQIVSGFVPAAFFGIISVIPAALVVAIALFVTLAIKNNVIDYRIEGISKELLSVSDPKNNDGLEEKIIELNTIRKFPLDMLSEIENRPILKDEIEDNEKSIANFKVSLVKSKETGRKQLENLEKQIEAENFKTPVVNQTRIEELKDSIGICKNNQIISEKRIRAEIAGLNAKIKSDTKRYRQLPFVFYLGSLFFVVCATFVFVFLFGYLGNFFFNAYTFRNDNQPAQWREFIRSEKAVDSRQPLLSTTLNILIITIVVFLSLNQFVPILEEFLAGLF
jgi:hypothetical protein